MQTVQIAIDDVIDSLCKNNPSSNVPGLEHLNDSLCKNKANSKDEE